ncbi:MAG: type I restriction endonuclease subunit R [Brevinematales bacterium]|nr:type I restriction endonuclease subunit R [Brevinematales bacterium]
MDAGKEKAFEAYIQETMTAKGWASGSKDEWDKEHALFPGYAVGFIRDTQPKLWAEMENLHGAELPAMLIDALVKERALKGTMHILRHGFKFYGKAFELAYFRPANDLVPETLESYGKNLLHVTRQVPCHPWDGSTVDMVLSLNGIPVATVELKNPFTGQTWRDAVAQYKSSRDPRAPLFQFVKGAPVHFAADPDEVYMATRLSGDSTWFLPFNRGSNPGAIECGAGNPLNPDGHRTAYFWEEVLARDSFLDIAGSYIFLEKKTEKVDDGKGGHKKVEKETMIFPRYHQLDSVRKLILTSRGEGSGNNYLIQHSAGSGKTNSISWLSHRLSSLHSKGDKKIFDCVIVITDRRILDKQLQDAIYQIEHKSGVVLPVEKDSRQLAQALVDGTQIVITTLQKFPFILNGLLHIAGADSIDNPDDRAITMAKDWQEKIANRNYAVIVDEAHSSQTGESAAELKKLLGAGSGISTDEAEFDWEDGLNRVLETRGKQKNMSFFAFTATPKGKTMEIFGRVGADGKPAAFHTYSMRQAIEEGFILDVLQRYTTYDTYFKIIKTIEDNPLMPKKKAEKKLTKFLVLHPHNIEQKTEIIIEHFRDHVRSKIQGRAKAMVVTGSRLHAVRYKLSFDKYIAENHYTDIRTLVAFSGTVKDEETGKPYTEPEMNKDIVTGKPISELQLPNRFASSDYQVLIVANKYQTGFDQPLLCAMYVDKRLDNVQAVQTLSRLNRIYSGKEPPFVLDFVNSTEDIYQAFKPYYDVTTLEEPSDPLLLEQLKHEMDEMQVYRWEDVEALAKIFYLPKYLQKPSDHAEMEKLIDPSKKRFDLLDEEHRKLFYEKITAYTKYYAFISQVIPYFDTDWEILYCYCKKLLKKIFLEENGENPHPEDDVELEYYRVEMAMSGKIDLSNGETPGVKSPTAVGTSKSKDEQTPLSEIIQLLNDKLGTEFNEEERLLLDQITETAVNDDRVIQTAKANSLEKFMLGIKAVIEAIVIQRMAENDDFVSRFMSDPDFNKAMYPPLAKEIYHRAKLKIKSQYKV